MGKAGGVVVVVVVIVVALSVGEDNCYLWVLVRGGGSKEIMNTLWR